MSTTGNLIPPKRYNKNVQNSKHRIITDIYICLKMQSENSTTSDCLLEQRSLRISNYLYGNDVMSTKEL